MFFRRKKNEKKEPVKQAQKSRQDSSQKQKVDTSGAQETTGHAYGPTDTKYKEEFAKPSA